MEDTVRFGPFRFEPPTGRLWSREKEIRLTPKAAAVLRQLVLEAGRPVTREELLAAVWDGAAVSDDALNSCVKELRRALADDARRPRYIETRHRRGYRFASRVLRGINGDGEIERAGTAASGDAASIAVLPFADMSPERDQDFFCEGLAEELINALTHVEGLRVAARSSSFQFRGPAVDVGAAGRQLGVATLLEGSVRKMGDRLRVTVQLVETGNGYHRWSQRFDRDVGDVFAIQDEIAENVATSLRGDLSRREKEALRRPETEAAAYEFYLRGRQHLHRLRHTDLKESLRLFEHAVGLDPEYAPAWSGIAAARAVLYQWWGARDADLAEADRASRRALELAPDLAEAHAARGLALSLARRYAEAEREFDRAIAVNPNLFDPYYDFARMCFARGQVDRSAALFRKASEVRQEDYQSALLLGQSLRMLGREREAREAESEGLARARRALALNPLDGRALSLASHALFDDGRVEEALEWSRRALDLYPDEISPLINGAGLRARLGMKEEALDLLERVFARGWGKCDWVAQDPDYDSLRDEPRFQRLIVGLK